MLYHAKVSEDSLYDFRETFSRAVAKTIENDTYEIVIAVNDIDSLDSFIYPVLFGIAKKLKKYGVVDLAYNKIFLETRTNKSEFKSGIIIASYVTGEYLNEILLDPRATDVYFVSDTNDELQQYLSHNHSVELNDL